MLGARAVGLAPIASTEEPEQGMGVMLTGGISQSSCSVCSAGERLPGEEQKWFGYASFTLGECAKGVLAGSGLPASAVLAYHCQKVDFFFFPGPLISA